MKKLSLVNNNIVLIGPMGSGKTSIGRELSKLTNLKFIDIDDEIEKSTGIGVTCRQHCGGQERHNGKKQFVHRYPQTQLKSCFTELVRTYVWKVCHRMKIMEGGA